MMPFVILTVALMLIVILGLFAWLFLTLRATTRDDARAPRPRPPSQGDESNIVDTGRGALKVVAVTLAVGLGLAALIFGSFVAVTSW